MKKLILTLALILSSQVFADEISSYALNTLMSQNPLCESAPGEYQGVNSLIAPFMMSEFDENGEGPLGVVQSSCETESMKLICKLQIISSTRIYDALSDSYIPSEWMLESGLYIDFVIDIETSTVEQADCQIAG